MSTPFAIRKQALALAATMAGAIFGMGIAEAAPLTLYSRTQATARFSLATAWTLDSGNPAGAQAPRAPSIAEGDTAIIRAGHLVLVAPGGNNSTLNLIIEDGTLRVANVLFVHDVEIDAAGAITSDNAGAFYFWGNSGDPAGFRSDSSPTEISRFHVGNFNSGINSPVAGGYLILEDPLGIKSRMTVFQDATIEFVEDGALVDWVAPTLPFNPSSIANYNFAAGTTIVYNTGTMYDAGIELQPQEAFSSVNSTRSPRNIEVRTGTEVDLRPRPAGTYWTSGLSIEPQAAITDQDNENGIVASLVTTLDLQDDGEIRKTIDDSSSQWGTDTLIDFGIAGAMIDFESLPSKSAAKGGGSDSVLVEREGNDPNGPNGGTLTLEHYRVIPSSSSFDIQALGLPDRGTAPTFPRICRRDLNDIPPGISSTCFAAVLTSLNAGIVTYDSTGQSATYITSAESGSQNLLFVHDAQDPLLVDLMSLEAVVSRTGQVSLVWETAAEIDNVGFHVYRSDEDGNVGEQLTTTIIPAEGTSWAGAVYVFEDPVPMSGRKSRYYYLEDVDANGVRTLHGPVEASGDRIEKGKSI